MSLNLVRKSCQNLIVKKLFSYLYIQLNMCMIRTQIHH